MTSFSTYALLDLLDAFAASDPVPGGGSATAVAGALGTSLLIMVASLPKTRTGAPEEVADLAAAAARLRPLRDTFVELIDRDTAAYQGVMAAMRLPRGTDAEQAARRSAIDAAMRGATEAPLETMRACQQALAGARVIADNGHVAAASDAGVGVELLLAALRGAALNVDTNLAGLKDAAYVDRIRAERRQLEEDGVADATAARARRSP
jgi:formiminotetrahydrofolate cyclodeaminase